MQWYLIDEKYMSYLRAVDSFVPYTNYGDGKIKPFFGEILKTEQFSYYAPISSGKPKHKTVPQSSTFYKMMSSDGKFVVAVIDLKHCVPVPRQYATPLVYADLSSVYNISNADDYIALLTKELQWVTGIQSALERNFVSLRTKIISNPSLALRKKCLNFSALEIAALKYTETSKSSMTKV